MRNAFCSSCGAKFDDVRSYPRTCARCGVQTWANPIPVTVVLLPITDGDRTGLLVVRRAIPPIGALALVGGFVEEHESWQACGARELREEANVVIDPSALAPLWFASSEPRPDRLLVFGLAPAIAAAELPPFVANPEALERGVIFGPGDAAGALGFPLHVEAAQRYFSARGIAGPLDFTPC
jgi:ADP-ribose pyrophosphatase YjhB (NUDIX family)